MSYDLLVTFISTVGLYNWLANYIFVNWNSASKVSFIISWIWVICNHLYTLTGSIYDLRTRTAFYCPICRKNGETNHNVNQNPCTSNNKIFAFTYPLEMPNLFNINSYHLNDIGWMVLYHSDSKEISYLLKIVTYSIQIQYFNSFIINVFISFIIYN